jgi:hypothetical protein
MHRNVYLFVYCTLQLLKKRVEVRQMDVEGSHTSMLKKYREWIYGIGVLVIVVTFYLLIMRAHTSGGSFRGEPLWVGTRFQYNLKIWISISSVTIILMVLVGYFTRRKK